MNRTKRKIFECSMNLFAEKGYDATSVEVITAVSGVAKGTLYYHFDKKEDILNMLLEEGMRLLKNSIIIKTRKCETVFDKLKAIILIQIKVAVKYENFLNIVFSEMWGKDEKGLKCKEYVYEYIEILENIVQEGIDSGEFYEGDVKAISAGIFGVTFSSLLYKIKQEEINIDNIYNVFIDTIVRGMVKDKESLS